MAGVHGFEPRLKASKASVLPLDDTPIQTELIHDTTKHESRKHTQKKGGWSFPQPPYLLLPLTSGSLPDRRHIVATAAADRRSRQLASGEVDDPALQMLMQLGTVLRLQHLDRVVEAITISDRDGLFVVKRVVVDEDAEAPVADRLVDLGVQHECVERMIDRTLEHQVALGAIGFARQRNPLDEGGHALACRNHVRRPALADHSAPDLVEILLRVGTFEDGHDQLLTPQMHAVAQLNHLLPPDMQSGQEYPYRYF